MHPYGMQVDIKGKPVVATVVQYAAREGRHEVEWRQESCGLETGTKGTQMSRAWVYFAADIVYREVV
jgi:hypothetical protein